AGTILEDTKLPLSTWFLAAHLVLTTKKSVTSHELARKLGVKQETAWYLQQRLARVVRRAYGRKLFGLVEVDETYVGGRTQFEGRGTGKRTVVALVENRGPSAGSLRLEHVASASRACLEPVVVANVQPGSAVLTDGWAGYHGIEDQGYDHAAQAQGDASRAKEHLPWVHVVFSNLKRVLHGVHTKAADDHLQGQLDLYRFRFDHRADLGRGLAIGLAALVATPRATRSDLKNGTPAEEFY
ncbi:MAG: IS1595 family transposase, partial [Myxococcota bacterium]